MTAQSIVLDIVGVNVRIECEGTALCDLLAGNFEGMMSAGNSHGLEYRVRPEEDANGISVARAASDFRVLAKNAGELIYLLEADLVVQLQLMRPDLFFLHSAVISDGSGAVLVTGRSGAGKSTTCWGLLHHGFHYLSDELAPISLVHATVFPYSHALCMKSRPPNAYPVPADAHWTDRGVHIPPSAMPLPAVASDLPIKAMFFVEYKADADTPVIEEAGHAEAATRLYPNVLNALAHDKDGLAAVVQLTKHVPCFRVDAADLAATCIMIRDTVARSGPDAPRRS